MNKDFELKSTLADQTRRMRGRINQAIKQLRDEGEEMKRPQAKTLGVIPVTGRKANNFHKHYHNKGKDEF